MSNWKYTDASNAIVARTNADGSCESCLIEAIADWLAEGNTPEPADLVPVPTQAQIAQGQIDAIEAKTMMNRAVREGMLAMTEFAAATQKITPDILYADNAAYKAVKDVDNQIRQLRALL